MEHGEKPIAALKVVALCGSLRPGSLTRKAIDLAIDGAKKAGADVTLVDLANLWLPPFDDTQGLEKEYPQVERFRTLVRQSDALLVATPTYHDSYSGVLKNAFDLLYYEELSDKLAALISVGGGRVGQGQALEHLRAVLREAGTWVLPRQVVIPSAQEAFDEEGKLKDREMEMRLTVLGQELVLRTKQLRPRRRS